MVIVCSKIRSLPLNYVILSSMKYDESRASPAVNSSVPCVI